MSNTAQVEPTEEQRSDAAAFYYKSIQSLPLDVCDWVETGAASANVDADVLSLARLLAEREAKLQARIDALEQSEHDVHVAIYECLVRAPAMGVRLHIDGEPDRMARAVVDWVKAATKVLEGRDVVSLATFHRVEAERDTLRARVAELEADLAAFMFGEAQHLADIKALREALGQGYALSLNAREQVLKATAHYDDAKAAEGGEG